MQLRTDSTQVNKLVMYILLILILLSISYSSDVYSQTEAEGTPVNAITPVLSEGLSSNYIQKVVTALVMVIFLILAISALLKKFNLVANPSTGILKIISSLPLGGKDKLILIEVGDEKILIGTSSSGLTKIHTMGSDFNPSIESVKNDTKGNQFLEILSTVGKGKKE